MSRKFILKKILLVVFVFVLTSFALADSQRPQVLILGDSISIGYTEQVKELLAGSADVYRPTKEGKVINCGSTWMGLDGVEEWLGDKKWDVIHFNWGLWDLCYRNPQSRTSGNRDKINGKVSTTLQEYEQNLEKIVSILKKTNAKLIWAATTPVPDGEAGRIKGDEIKYNAVAEKVMRQSGVMINDLHSYMLPESSSFFRAEGDVHFTTQGSDFLAKKVVSEIYKHLTPIKAAQPKTELLFPEGAPFTKVNEEKDKPTLTVYLPDVQKANGTAIVIYPGGGYVHLAMDHEGKQFAEWFNSIGIAAFVLKYRNNGAGYQHPVPLIDAQRAITTVRAKAELYNIDPGKIGIIGFSAGGHLASTAGTHFNTPDPKGKTIFDRTSNRPDFMILVYPVISLTEDFTHQGSKNNLLGPNPDPELVKSLSNELQVTADTPPAFLIHADDDRGVPPENSIAFYSALKKAEVPAEMHIYLKGGHGFGLGKQIPGTADWPKVCEVWLKNMGFILTDS